MSLEKYITSSCAIRRQAIYKDGKLLFENKESDLPGFLLSAYRFFDIQYPKFHKMDNLCKTGWLAAEMLINDSLPTGKYQSGEVGVVLANANSSLDTDIRYYESTKEIASPALFVYTLPNIVIGEICIRHHFNGENAFFITEQFDAALIEQYVSNLFNNDILQACICGWVELLNEEYKTVLFLVERGSGKPGMAFSKENLNKTYQLENG